MPLLDSYFEFFYAKEIIDVMTDVFKKKCDGCKDGALSQLNHQCLMLSTKEQLELYWDYVLREINEIRVIEKWYGTVYMLDSVPIEVIDLYKSKLDCRDWRDTDMKMGSWKNRLIKMAISIMKLEKRFT